MRWRPAARSKDGRRELGIEALVRTNVQLEAREPEERLPADEPPRTSEPPAQIARFTAADLVLEEHRKELAAGVSCEVRPIGGPHHAVPKAIGHLKLDRDVGFAAFGLIEAAPIGEDVIHHGRPDESWQDLVKNDPLVMPGRQSSRRSEHVLVLPCRDARRARDRRRGCGRAGMLPADR